VNVVAYVTPFELRGVPFDAYAAALAALIRDGLNPAHVVVMPADRAEVTIDGKSGSDAAQEVLTTAREITRPDHVAEHFGWPLPLAWRHAYVKLNGLPPRRER
jgi:hypothetical protein